MLIPKVIIIGGGFAGLSAATALASDGVSVLVIEARPSLGGRATAFRDSKTGERIDNGQHVFFGCYEETFRFLRRIGAESNLRLQRQLSIDFILPSGRQSRLTCPPLPAPFHLFAGLLDWDALSWSDRFAVLKIYRPLKIARAILQGSSMSKAAASPDETVRQWLVRNGQTPKVVSLFWEPLALAALNQSIDRAAAPPFVGLLARLFGQNSTDAAIALAALPLDETYAEPARQFIETCRGHVMTHASGHIILTKDGRPQVVINGLKSDPCFVICAAPWFELPKILGEVPSMANTVSAAAQTEACPIITVNLWFDRPVCNSAFISLPGRRMQWVFAKQLIFGDQVSYISLISSDAGALVDYSNQDLINLAIQEIRDVFPKARETIVRHATVVRERRSTFSTAPGQPKRPSTKTSVPGLFLAGDWIDTGLPATIESAVASGHRAAQAVRALLPFEN